MGEFDQPALWRYVLNHTGAKQATFIGHNQGCTQMFASMTQFPDFYKSKMKRFIAIAPLIYAENISSEVMNKYWNDDQIKTSIEEKMGCEVFTYQNAEKFVNETLLADNDGTVASIVRDSRPDLINDRAVANYSGFFPAGTSMKSMLHFK